MKKSVIISIISFFTLVACSEEVLYDFEENLARELNEIETFLTEADLETTIYRQHLSIRFEESGNGITPQENDTIYYYYELYLLDSTLIVSNVAEVLEQYGYEADNPGPAVAVRSSGFGIWSAEFFNAAIELSSLDSDLQIWAPSYLAFGDRIYGWGGPSIPPSSPVMARFRVVDIRPGE